MADFKEIQIGNGQVYKVKDETARESAGGGDGTVTAVKMNNGTPIEPDENGVVNLGTVITQHQDISGKVDKEAGKGLSTNDYTDAEKTKLGGIAAGAEVNTIEGIIVNGTEVTPDSTTKKVSITSTAGKSAYQSYLDTTEDDPAMTEAEWVASLKGNKGDAGNVTVSDGVAEIDIVNDLTTGGAGDALSAEMGLLIKREVNRLYTSLSRLYGKLANMAFWDAQDQEDAEPTPLKWNVPQVTLAFDLTGVGSGVSVKLNDEAVTGNVSVDKGSTATLTIEAKDDWVLNNDIAVEVGGVSQQLTTIGNIYSLDIVANANAAVEVVGTADRDWITANKDDVTESNVVTKYGMQLGRSIHADYGTTVGGVSGSTPNCIMYPAGEPLSTRIFTSDSVPNTPGTSAAYFLDARNSAGTAGKRYMRVKVEDADIGSDVYRIIVALYSQTGGAYVSSTTNINGWVVRPDYQSITNDQAVFDLNTLATGKGLSAGAIKYAKLLVFRRQGGATGSNVDSRTWYEDVSIKYCFTDD